MKDIFDRKTGKWYRVKRGWFNKLRLEEIIYKDSKRCFTSSDLVFGLPKEELMVMEK